MLDRTQAPPVEEISVPKIPQASKEDFDGLELYVVDQGTQPILLFEIEIPTGRWTEPTPGLTYYVAKILTEGTGKRSSEQIAETFDFYGSHLEITPTLDHVNIKLYTLKKFFLDLIRLLAELLFESSMPEKEFEVLKKIRIQQIRQQQAKNDAYAGLKFREILYGEIHPYGLIIDDAAAQTISLEDVKAFYPSFLVKPTFYLAGMIDNSTIEAVKQAFSQRNYQMPGIQHKIPIESGSSTSVIREGSTQASLRQGHLIISRHHQDTHLLKITNTLFGGFFGSRLMKNIREEKGLTYGIHSSIIHLDHSSYWSVSTEVLKEKLEMASEEILKELEKLQNQLVSIEELKTVTSYLKGKYVTSFDTPFNTLNMIKNLQSGKLDDEYYETFLQTLDTITPEQVCEIAQKHLRVDKIINLSVT